MVEFLTITGPPRTIVANPRPASHVVLITGASCNGQIHVGTGQSSGNDISGHNQGVAINGDCVDVVHNRLHDNDGGLLVRGGVPTGAVPSNGLLISDGARNVARGNDIFENNTMLLDGVVGSGTVFYDAAGRGAPGEPPDDNADSPLNDWNQNNRCLTQNEEVPPGTCGPDEGA